MSDALTEQIIKQIKDLPAIKKKAILELLKDNGVASKQLKQELHEWQKKLLETSVWTDEEIEEIQNARGYINKWLPNLSL